MKKALTFLLAFGFFSTSTLNITASACGGPGLGPTVKNVKLAPPLKEKNEIDPEYIYNDDPLYSEYHVNLVMGISGQIAIKKIKADVQKNKNSNIWKKFYDSYDWTDGSFTEIGLINNSQSTKKRDFSYTAKDDNNLEENIFFCDKEKKNNKVVKFYWFITNSTSEKDNNVSNKSNLNETSIIIPSIDKFEREEKIVRFGWLHMYLKVPGFKIDFWVRIDVTFKKLTIKDNSSVVLHEDTWKWPFGMVDDSYDVPLSEEVSQKFDKFNIKEE